MQTRESSNNRDNSNSTNVHCTSLCIFASNLRLSLATLSLLRLRTALHNTVVQRRQSGLKSGGHRSGSKNFDFYQATFRKISISRDYFPKNFDFSRYLQNGRLPDKIYDAFTATTTQIFLITFQHTYYLLYNNI